MGQGRGAKPHPVFFGSWGRAKILVVQPGAVPELNTTKTKTGNPRLKRGSENLRLSRAATARAWPTPQKNDNTFRDRRCGRLVWSPRTAQDWTAPLQRCG